MSTQVSDNLGWLSNLKSGLVSNSTGPLRGVTDQPSKSRRNGVAQSELGKHHALSENGLGSLVCRGFLLTFH